MARVTPGPSRLRRGLRGRGGLVAFGPRDGGRLELAGVLAGEATASRASSAAIRAAWASTTRAGSRISSSFSRDVSRDGSNGGMRGLTHIRAWRASPLPPLSRLGPHPSPANPLSNYAGLSETVPETADGELHAPLIDIEPEFDVEPKLLQCLRYAAGIFDRSAQVR